MAPTDVTPTKSKQVFFSKAPNQRLVRAPKVTRPTELGGLRTLTETLTYEFSDHYLVVDKELRERDARYFKKYGEILEQPDTRPAEEWLRDHPKMNGEHGFVEIEPTAPSPNKVLQAIAAAAIAGDSEALVKIHEEEEREWNRAEVLEAAENGLRMLEERDAASKAPVQT